MFESAGLLTSRDADALSLLGRLLKDRALSSREETRRSLFDQSEQAYLQSAGARPATYPLINAATVALLNDKPEQARQLARQTLDLLASGQHEPETAYWLGATRAEALLLLDRPEAGRQALEQAIAGTPSAWEDHAATIRQLRLIVERTGGAASQFDHLLPPASLHFSGIIHLPCEEGEVHRLIDEALDEIDPGFLFGALAAGTDIMIAERALERGAALHVVLPAPVQTFRSISVAPFGETWVSRFDALIDLADSVETLAFASYISDAAIMLSDEIAMGRTIRHARSLASDAIALRLRRTIDKGTPADAAWRARGLPIHDLSVAHPARHAHTPLAQGDKRAILVAECPDALDIGLPFARATDGACLLALDDLQGAIEAGMAVLRAQPTASVGLVYDVVSSAHSFEEDPYRIASCLARSAPDGTICAAAPGALAIDLCAPDHRFEGAGELVTPFGAIPISLLAINASA